MKRINGPLSAVHLVLFSVLHTCHAAAKEVIISAGVSILCTVIVCCLISVVVWRCCLRTAGAKKYQYEVDHDINKSYVISNTEACDGGGRIQCPKCGHTFESRLSDVPAALKNEQTIPNVASSVNTSSKTVDVLVHNDKQTCALKKVCVGEEPTTPKDDIVSVLCIGYGSIFWGLIAVLYVLSALGNARMRDSWLLGFIGAIFTPILCLALNPLPFACTGLFKGDNTTDLLMDDEFFMHGQTLLTGVAVLVFGLLTIRALVAGNRWNGRTSDGYNNITLDDNL